METNGGGPSLRPIKLDEDGHFFDFIAFYKKVEFCDRSIRLEILEEYRKVRGAKKDADTQMADVNSDEAGQVPASTAPGDVRAESGEAPDGLGEMNRDSDKEKQAGHSMREEGKEPAPENSQGEAQEESPGAEAKESENGNAPLKRAEGASAHSEAEAGESEKPDGLATEDVWVEEIPVNSIVLAAKSCVLQRMLSNGMKESDKSEPLLLKVTPQEKEAFKEMLRYMYAGSLSSRFLQPDASIRALVDLLIVGDKFEVGSLMGAVLKVLSKRKRTVSDDVVLALEIPDALEQYPEIKALISGARARVVEAFKDVESWSESLDFLTLGQDVVSFLLKSEELDAASEEEILLAVLVWVRNNFDGLPRRQKAMSQLSEHLRFGLMRGEFLLRSVLPVSEMALPETQERVMSGIYFQAFSDAEKLKSKDLYTQPRTGMQGSRLEILCSFALDEAGASKSSPSAVWIGKQWRIDVQKDDRQDPPTVGIFLVTSKLTGEEGTMPSTKVDFTFYVRVWPRGYWKTMNKVFAYEFKTEGDGYGIADAFNMSWEEARKSRYYSRNQKF